MKNKILGVVAVAIAVVEAILTMQLVPSFIAAGDPGPKVFPMISAVLFFICGIAIFFQKEDKSKEKQFMTKEQWKRLGILLGVLVVYALLMYFFGFLPSTIVALFVICTLFAGETKVHIVVRILYAVILGVAVWYLLQEAFMVPLPSGILFE